MDCRWKRLKKTEESSMGMLEGKVALITGAGTGIGKGTALRFVKEGAKVVIAARRIEKLKEACALAPENMSWVSMDLNDAEERARALASTVERHGRLDVLVSNAGSQLWKSFEDTTEEDIEDIYQTNLASTVRFVKQAVPYLEKSKGNIVIVSSTAGRYVLCPSQLLSVYGASKAGLNQFTRAVAPELGPKGIRINAVAPGLTRGEYADEGLKHNDVATQDWIRSVTPLGRMGEPDDIARVITFMASDMASWVTGQVLDASGGWQIAGG
jgi:NAD(P)-dependent dehydrogenase (short-subunit alcohol dehydrogenase family)